MQTRLMKELKGFLSHASITTPLKAPRLTYSGEQENQSMVRKVGAQDSESPLCPTRSLA